jgi:subtilisin family serine protease
MKYRTLARVALLVAICLLSLPAALAQQPSVPLGLPSAAPHSPPIQPNKLRGNLSRASGPVGIVIELEGAPTVQAYASAEATGATTQATRMAQAQLARVEQAQQSLLAPLASLGATVLYRTQRLYNGIAAHVDASKLEQIGGLPGVKAIHPLVRYERSTESSVRLIGAPELWQGVGAPPELTGAGLKIAIIDTGVDYLHAGFGGPGTQAAYTANNTKVITEVPSLFPTAKVVAGYDFAGDDYLGFNTPQPDPDPMDCNGHGSHVAGIAAGNGVLTNGATFTGPYNDPNLYTNNDFEIGPGVAPQASIVALRVFGCGGSTELVSQALEWAVDPNGDGNFADRVDVSNMSLGSDFGYENDTTSVAANNAVLAGTIVVASAGNDGDSYYITGSPGTSPRVISVASSADATDILDGFRVNTPVTIDGQYPASNSVAYNWASNPVTGTLVYPPAGQRTGCSSLAGAGISGKIVLLDYACGSTTSGANLVAAGAIGAILVDNSDAFDLFITGVAAIPMVSVPKSVGDVLKSEVGTGTVQVTLSGEYTSKVPYTDPNVADTLSAFSSRGPRRAGSALKPDISAPGQGIFSVGALTGTKGANISGTSMAAPHVAGAMVLMRQLHPTWTIEELKALVMNTALNNVRADLPASAALYSPARVGAGRIDLPRAAQSDVVAYENSGAGLVSVSFGNTEVVNTATASRTVRVFNKGGAPATYNLAYVPVTTASGVTYSLSAPSVTIPAGGSANVVITMNATATQMKHFHDPTVSETQSGLDRPWLSEASGYLALTESGLAVSSFAAWISDDQENPPSGSDVTASGVFTYTGGVTGTIDYAISFTKPITLTAAHFHSGLAGANGPVIILIPTGDTTFGPGDLLTGSQSVSAANAALLKQGGLYVNFHTAAHPGGEIRGQVVPALSETELRVPVYASARPASNMSITQTKLATTPTSAITLAGSGVNTGTSYPHDVVSLVSALELQYTSPNEAASSALNDKADLAYVGVASDVASTSQLTKTNMIYFGVATQDDWSTPNEVEFDIYIDTNRDGEDDFVLFNSNYGQQAGQDQNDILLTFLYNLNNNDFFIADYVNGASPSDHDTAIFNSNVMLLPVSAGDLGLTAASAKFNYRVETFSLDATSSEPSFGGAISGMVDKSTTLTYDAAKPGLDTTNGQAGAPTYEDLTGQSIPLKYNVAAYLAGRSKGLLLLHHHNQRGKRAQVLSLPVGVNLLPIIKR